MKKLITLQVKKQEFSGLYSVEGNKSYKLDDGTIRHGGTNYFMWTDSETEEEAYAHLDIIYKDPVRYGIDAAEEVLFIDWRPRI